MILMKYGSMWLETSFRNFCLSAIRNNEMVDVQISEEETTKKKSFNPLYRNYE
jgi:hypothetical protein